MAFPKEHLDLFELEEKTLEKINEQGKVELGHFDLSFRFSRDSNQLDKQLNFYLYIFDEEFSQTTFAKKYDTVDKMIKLLLKNLKSEYMYKNVREGLIMTKIKHLKGQLYETIREIKTVVSKEKDVPEKIIMVDIVERPGRKEKEKNGMPLFRITVQCRPAKLDFSIPIASNASDWEKDPILATLNEAL